jgi:hypothetical protein
MTPGDGQRAYKRGGEARQILNDAEDDLRKWEPDFGGESYHDAQDSVEYAGRTPESSIATGHRQQDDHGKQGLPLSEATLREEGHEPALAGSSSAGLTN